MAHDHAHGASGHAHAHGHGAGRAGNRRRLRVVLALAAAYMVAEAIGGVATNSLALLADAGHMLSDVAALALALFAMRIAERPATPRHSYGYYRTEILAALANGATLVAIAILVFVEAWERFRSPPAVQGAAMMAIAAGGLVVNLVGLRVLHGGRDESLNVRGAWLHVLTDALGSVGAIVGGLLVWRLGWAWADPAVSVLIGVLVVVSSWNLLRETVGVLMESAPGSVDVDAVRDALRGVPGVTAVHDLHVWSITSGMVACSAHVSVTDARPNADVLRDLRRALRDGFGIAHSTLQLEPEGFAREDCEGSTHA